MASPAFPVSLALPLFGCSPLARLPLTLALMLSLFRCLPLTRFPLAHAITLAPMFNKTLVIRSAGPDDVS